MEMGDSCTELRLGLPGRDGGEPLKLLRSGKRMLPRRTEEERESMGEAESIEEAAPATKAQVVGWPPIRSYRKNCFTERMRENEGVGLYVKVRMDGAPYMRKVDLNAYKGYKDLRHALEGLFSCAVGGFYGEEEKEKARMEVHVITYEDKDGDWMLAGDVPWEMFTSTCRRLRIMKSSEATGLSL